MVCPHDRRALPIHQRAAPMLDEGAFELGLQGQRPS
jgi:hypothetical protein